MRMRLGIVIVACTLVAAEKPEQAGNGQETAIVEIEKVDGDFFVDNKRPGKPIVQVMLSDTGVADAWLRHLAKLPTLQVLDLGRTKITDSGLKCLTSMPELHALCIGSTG
jgi:hypothetical protein